MPDVSVVQSGANNGTATPATPGSLTLTAHNLAVLVIAALGTSPTIATPAGWTQVQKTQGTALSVAMYILPNAAGGATNPSSTLGGTITGWIAAMYEFSQTGANEGLLQSFMLTNNVAQLANVYGAASGQTIPQQLFVYAVARATATITAQNTVLNWSNSVQPIAGVQGLSLDMYWASNLAQGPGPYPSASGLLSGAVNSVQIGAILNSIAAQPFTETNVGGMPGQLVGQFFQGMIGG